MNYFNDYIFIMKYSIFNSFHFQMGEFYTKFFIILHWVFNDSQKFSRKQKIRFNKSQLLLSPFCVYVYIYIKKVLTLLNNEVIMLHLSKIEVLIRPLKDREYFSGKV